MKRFYLTLGAKSTAGGVVTTATSPCTVNGVKVALEGDKVRCGGCKTEGTIRATWPRVSERWNGKQVALHNDICVCKCDPPPRLVASQKHTGQTISSDPDGVIAPAAVAGGVRAV
jgi:uncharacterized Zn-binding protein involved in type VI secretion